MSGTSSPMSSPDGSTQMHVVRRAFHGAGADRLPGEVLDTSGWPHGRAAALVAQRYLVPLGHGMPDPLRCDCGRAWRDETALVRHIEAGCETLVLAGEKKRR